MKPFVTLYCEGTETKVALFSLEKENIKLIYNKMPKITYKQLKTDEFIGGLSIVDAIFNLGFDNLKGRFSKNEI